jgi:hypothetical protein
MKHTLDTRRSGLAIFAAAMLIAGCNGLNSANPGPAGVAATSSHARPLTIFSTRVRIYNSGSSTITGTGSAGCWTISPTPLPSIGPGQHSVVETLSYNSSCGAGNTLDITYGGTAPISDCIFSTTYAGGFSYTATNSAGTDCSVSTSTNVTYDELFSYDPVGSLRKHR